MSTEDSYEESLRFWRVFVKAWFAYRVLKFSERLYIPVFCWFLSFLRCVATVVVAIEAFPAPSIIAFERQWQWLLTFILTVGAAVDIIIAVSFCYFIKQHRATSFGRTVKTINQLMIWTVGKLLFTPIHQFLCWHTCLETGLVTSVAAVSMLICVSSIQKTCRLFSYLTWFCFSSWSCQKTVSICEAQEQAQFLKRILVIWIAIFTFLAKCTLFFFSVVTNQNLVVSFLKCSLILFLLPSMRAA